jgi:phenylpropionate dioxygenase-like ring-hydroxylating dioxygenase large terminal subunit
MATDVSAREIQAFVDTEKGLVDRRIFSDQAIYELELEQIFARAWNFMGHVCQFPNPGDFFLTFIGEDRVIVVRDNEMNFQVLVNSCRHRGNAVCRAEEGHATSFMCTYHGWTYDLQGRLVGVPGFKEVYHEELDRENWGLIKAAHVDVYKGFIFATMDEAAPPLTEYLGEMGRVNLDCLADMGDMEAFPGITKYTINSNWKFPMDNTWDQYHGPTTHAAPRIIDAYGRAPRRPDGTIDMKKMFSNEMRYRGGGQTFIGEYGHGMTGRYRRGEGNMVDAYGNKTPQGGTRNIFPNVFMGTDIELRLPKGPHKTEVWMWSFVDKNQPPAERRKTLSYHQHHFGPSGFHEQDDGENWDQSTRGAIGVVSRRYPLHYAMGKGHGEIIEDELSPPRIENFINEHAQLWMYKVWAEMLTAPTWDDYRRNHSKPSGQL